MNYTKTIAVSELPEGTQKAVTLAGGTVALFHYGGKITGISGACPHDGGPLAEGKVEQGSDGALRVACPWHGWQFDITTGCMPAQNGARQAVYDVRIQDGFIFVSDTPRIPSMGLKRQP